jgi:hypothetical protein
MNVKIISNHKVFINIPFILNGMCKENKKSKNLCFETNCKKRGTFGLLNEQNLYCKDHKTEEMIDLKNKNKKCKHSECKKQASYGIQGTKKREFCKYHKTSEMIDLQNRKCEHHGCNKLPTFGYSGLKDAKYCKDHKSEDMIDVKNINKKCQYKDCKKRSHFGFKDQCAKYCFDHKEEGMQNLKSKKCQHQGCSKLPNYGIITPIFCKIHKTDEMKDLKHKRCEFIGCEKRPNFGLLGTNNATYCKDHKPENMIDLKNKKCGFKGCFTRANFSKKGEKKKYCKTHKTDDMVEINRKKCEHPECKIRPSYGFPGTKYKKFCKAHMEEGMIDLLHPKCIHRNCKIRANYGKLFQNKIHCASHKSKNEYENNHPKCEIKDCVNKPLYSDTNYPKRCEIHQEKGDFNIIEIRCISCGILEFINNSIGICNNCYLYNQKEIHKFKENETIDFLSKNGFKFVSTDKTVQNGCSKKRPDGIIDLGYLFICLEIDEDQHKSYACECEQGRMIQIHQDFGGSPVLFIRYNPDVYKDQFDKKQNIVIRKRLKVLLEVLNSIKNQLEREKEWNYSLSVIYLFYDGFDGQIITNHIDYINFYQQQESISN